LDLHGVHVVGQVEGGVVDPQRQPRPTGGCSTTWRSRGDQVQAPPELLADGVHANAAVPAAHWSTLGDRQDADVLRKAAVLEVEKAGVLDAQAVTAAVEPGVRGVLPP
jgi:hypothetical protein